MTKNTPRYIYYVLSKQISLWPWGLVEGWEQTLYFWWNILSYLNIAGFQLNIKSCLSTAKADIFIFSTGRDYRIPQPLWRWKCLSTDFSNDHFSWKRWFRVQTPSCSLKETQGDDAISRQCNSQRQSLDVTEHHGWFKYKPRRFTAGKSFSC